MNPNLYSAFTVNTSILCKSALITFKFILFIGCLLTQSASSYAAFKREIREPEAATGFYDKDVLTAKEYMVVAANPYASKAGFDILAKGGSAIDAAIAIQLVLTLVEPQSSGIGGGAFFLYWDQSKNKLTTFDGRETAPEKVTDKLFLDKKGQPIPWIKAIVGGRAVGVPGVLHALHKAHERYGKLPWEQLFTQAIHLAENGFVVSPRLHALVSMQFNPGLNTLPEINRYFFPNGQVIQVGDVLKNKKLANVYRSLAKEGIKPFYDGWISQKMVNAVQQSIVAPGVLSLKDMKAYQSKERDALCGPYQQYKVCSMGLPSSGGITMLQMLAMLNHFDLSSFPVNSVEALHLFTQSSRLAYADRARYLADPDFVDVPVQALLSPHYLSERAKLITDNDMGQASAGNLTEKLTYADEKNYHIPSTSHFSIIDKFGDAISMTSSIEMAFGSAVMVEGFILNNQLTDFSLMPEVEGKLVANRVEPFKRPLSSMTPTMVFNQDHSLKLIVGSPGGSRIINYVTQTVIGILDWHLTPQEAVSLPKITNRNKVTTLEKNTPITLFKKALEDKGHQVIIRDLNSGLHVIDVSKKGITGGADPRREGKVLGY